MEQIEYRSFNLLDIKPSEQHKILSIIDKVTKKKFVMNECLHDIRNYDIDTYVHSFEVAIISLFIGLKIELTTCELEELALSALLHDYGKIKIPIEIIDKPGKIDIVEREIVEAHPALGAYYLRQYGFNENIIHGVYEHHESYLGTEKGYPRHLMREEIHLFGRIIAIADKIDAYTSKRIYHEKRDIKELKKFIRENDDLDLLLIQKTIPYIIEKSTDNNENGLVQKKPALVEKQVRKPEHKKKRKFNCKLLKYIKSRGAKKERIMK